MAFCSFSVKVENRILFSKKSKQMMDSVKDQVDISVITENRLS